MRNTALTLWNTVLPVTMLLILIVPWFIGLAVIAEWMF